MGCAAEAAQWYEAARSDQVLDPYRSHCGQDTIDRVQFSERHTIHSEKRFLSPAKPQLDVRGAFKSDWIRPSMLTCCYV